MKTKQNKTTTTTTTTKKKTQIPTSIFFYEKVKRGFRPRLWCTFDHNFHSWCLFIAYWTPSSATLQWRHNERDGRLKSPAWQLFTQQFIEGADKKKQIKNHQRSASLTFVRGIHRWAVNSLHNGPVTRNMFPFDDVINYNETTFDQDFGYRTLVDHLML